MPPHGGGINLESALRFSLQHNIVQFPVNIDSALTVLLYEDDMMPFTIVGFGGRLHVVDGWPSGLSDVKINSPTCTAAIGADVKKWVAVAGVTLRKQPEVILPIAIDLGPHGDGERFMLVGREMIRCCMDAAKQGLFFIGEGEGVADFTLDDIVGTHVVEFHVIAVDQLRCFRTLNLIQRPISDQILV